MLFVPLMVGKSTKPCFHVLKRTGYMYCHAG